MPNLAVTTADIDFGVVGKDSKGKNTIASYVQRFGYGKRHVSMDRMVPFVPIVKDNLINEVNLRKYFRDVDSQGPFLVEQENGPDEFIHNNLLRVIDKPKRVC